MRIGIDLDNTIIFYDHSFIRAAVNAKWLPQGYSGTKQQLRDAIRKMPDGETKWQKIQGYVYGKGLQYATPFEGVEAFLHACQRNNCEVNIVSHKTEFGHYDPDRVPLRDAARHWLKERGLFNTGALMEKNISFHSTRTEKVDAIKKLAPDWFIDDLVEVYEEPGFPRSARKVLFHTSPSPAPPGDWIVCKRWRDITKAVFGHD